MNINFKCYSVRIFSHTFVSFVSVFIFVFFKILFWISSISYYITAVKNLNFINNNLLFHNKNFSDSSDELTLSNIFDCILISKIRFPAHSSVIQHFNLHTKMKKKRSTIRICHVQIEKTFNNIDAFVNFLGCSSWKQKRSITSKQKF